jgi:CO dehydrogenase maturation factor
MAEEEGSGMIDAYSSTQLAVGAAQTFSMAVTLPTAIDGDYRFLVVSDATGVGIRSAQRIGALIAELALPVRRMALVVNRSSELPPAVEAAIAADGLELAGLVPDDPWVAEFELAGRPLLELPDEAPAVVAVDRMLAALGAVGGRA